MIPAFDCMITDPPCKPRASGDDPADLPLAHQEME